MSVLGTAGIKQLCDQERVLGLCWCMMNIFHSNLETVLWKQRASGGKVEKKISNIA
jgi:hypothetical protein